MFYIVFYHNDSLRCVQVQSEEPELAKRKVLEELNCWVEVVIFRDPPVDAICLSLNEIEDL
jgi:hypothetical protein